jgi:hypothetical protein
MFIESQKSNEEMKIKLEFDHQMIEDKDREIERLLDERKALRVQIDNFEKLDKN